MPILTAQKWPAANSRWRSIEDLSLLFHLSLLEANLSPSFTSTTRAGENGQLPSITIMANIPGCKYVVLAQVRQPSPQKWVVDRVPLFRTAAIVRLQEKSGAVGRGRNGSRPKSKANPKKVLAHGHREESADLETYLNRGYIDVGSELFGPTDLTRLEGSLRSCARREGRFLRAFRTQKGSITFCCAIGAACPFRLQFQVPTTPSPGVEWRCTRLCATHSCRAVDTPLITIMDRQMLTFPVIKLGTPPEAVRAPASQAAAPAGNRHRHLNFIKGEEDDDEPEPVEEEDLAAEPAAHRVSTPVDMEEDDDGELDSGAELYAQQVRLQEEEHENLNQQYLRKGVVEAHGAHKVQVPSFRRRSGESPSSRQPRHDRDVRQESPERRQIARNLGEVPRSQAPDLAFSKGLRQEPDGTSSFKRPTEATQDYDMARPTKKVAIVPAKKVSTFPRSQTEQASGAVIKTESTNGAVATTLPTRSLFDASESCPRAGVAPGVTFPNKVSAVAGKSFKKASTSALPVVASGSASAKVPAAGARAQVAQGTPPKPTIKCLLPSTADQSRSKPPAVELLVRRPTVRLARTKLFSTADGRSTTVSAKGDFLGVWVPKH